ncbi:MAG TPA: hypothetical protein VK642_05725 [Burkholderiales bacterium]|nr:hypothetical protein [Burkholderiales bacterium]
MKKFVSTMLAVLFVAGPLMIASSDADANGRHRHHHHRGHVGVFIGAPLVVSPWPYYQRPYYGYGYDSYPYYAPVVREEPMMYLEQPQTPAPPAPQSQAPQQQYWYFCQDSQTYYPHVQNCATPWQRVIPHAPR